MMVGAVAAIAGAGTFASFSASTTNDAAFNSARVALSNGVGATTCYSPSANPQAGSGVATADIDTGNDASGCAALFAGSYTPGSDATTSVTIKNEGDDAGNVYLFSTATCSSGLSVATKNAGTGDLCGQLQIAVERTTDHTCIYGAVDSGDTDGDTFSTDCKPMTDATTSQAFSDFDSKDFANKLTAATSLAANASNVFQVRVHFHKSTGNTECIANVGATATDDSPVDGFADASGIGCDNKFMNLKASLNLRWLMQA
jgi:hypothetical protein